MEQQTPEWDEIKIIFPFSASSAQAIQAMGKGLDTLIKEKLIAKYSAQDPERFESGHLDRGNTEEPDISDIYELTTGNKVTKVGFITNENICSMAGVSPDALVNDDGMAEYKSLSDTAYYEKLKQIGTKGEFKIDSNYFWQCQMQMLFAERKWNDHCLYNPNWKKSILIQRIYADAHSQQKLITGLAYAVRRYKEEEAIIKKSLNIK